MDQNVTTDRPPATASQPANQYEFQSSRTNIRSHSNDETYSVCLLHHHIPPSDITIQPRHAMPHHATPHHDTPRHAAPCHAQLHATPRHAQLHATPRHATPCQRSLSLSLSLSRSLTGKSPYFSLSECMRLSNRYFASKGSTCSALAFDGSCFLVAGGRADGRTGGRTCGQAG